MTQERLYRGGNYEASGYDAWQTPPEVIADLEAEFDEMFDPCPADWDGLTDGLAIDWPTDRACFVNPPYSHMADWVAKCAQEWRRGCTVILLIPPRTCTRYFHDHIYGNAELRFFKGRLKFCLNGVPGNPAPFPSMLCVFRSE